MVHVTLESQNANIGYCIKLKYLLTGGITVVGGFAIERKKIRNKWTKSAKLSLLMNGAEVYDLY